jgi:hypothetical protein
MLHIEYTLHQVCNSAFINQSWISYFTNDSKTWLQGGDFRITSPHTLGTLKIFCDLSNRTISDSLIPLYSNQYVSALVISLALFQSEIKSLVDQFRSSMTNSFLLSLSMIRETTQANALFSALQTNYKLTFATDRTTLLTQVIDYDGCPCFFSATCTTRSSILDHLSPKSLFDVPGLRMGCYMIESLLQSTLECFYSQTCIDTLRSYLTVSSSMPVIALNASLSSVYNVNSTIQELVDNLMIEQWNASPTYERYYNECHPTQCTYTFETRNDLIYIFTTLFGITGGLTTVLKLIVPRLVKFIMYCIQKQRTRVVPEMSVVVVT